MKYQVALLKDGGPTTYESTNVIASDNNQALKKAKERTTSLDYIAEDAWLQIASNGVAIRSLRPGEVLMVQRRMKRRRDSRPWGP